MVRLLLRVSIAQCIEASRFNPTMVRLLLNKTYGIWQCLPMFQSHNGAIAALLYIENELGTLPFQSHNGAIAAGIFRKGFVKGFVSIPQWCDCCMSPHSCVVSVRSSFNPTMVRLLPTLRASVLSRLFVSFNPTMVRLLPVLRLCAYRSTSVSIPQWCDCCITRTARKINLQTVSIPQWCDCCWNATKVADLPFPFQSHNGAIAAKEDAFYEAKWAVVSIPQWCDCC